MNQRDTVYEYYKREGETPLEAIGRFREEYPQYSDAPITYAGRLDPLAHGTLLLLVGDAVHNKDAYLAADKTYRVIALIGYATDTYDLLGIPSDYIRSEISSEKFNLILKNSIGKQSQPYPPYSSRTVDSKPLWQWAREGRLDEIEIPTHDIKIYGISDMDMSSISQKDLLERIHTLTDAVTGDFRQKEILAAWEKVLDRSSVHEYTTFSFTVSCSSGTYIRSLVHELGRELEIGACVYALERTEILTKETLPQ